MRRQLFFAVACLGLLCVYGFALIWVEGYAAALPIPPRWVAFFSSRSVGFLALVALYDTVALVLVGLPVALVIARFGGRRATVVALIMATILFVVTIVPSLIEDISRGAFARLSAPYRLYITFAHPFEFIAVLPLLVWLFRRLPSNKRLERP